MKLDIELLLSTTSFSELDGDSIGEWQREQQKKREAFFEQLALILSNSSIMRLGEDKETL